MSVEEKYIGKQFGRLTVISLYECVPRIIKKTGSQNGYCYYFNCKCDCGNKIVVKLSDLTRGHKKSCNCLRTEMNTERIRKIATTKNGETVGRYARLYHIYNGMIARCYKESCKEYLYYGNRGIQICDEWKTDYNNFKIWALQHGYSDNLEIDRIDNDKNYCPENCRWATRKEQMNNFSKNKIINYKGKTQTLSEWCEELGLDYNRTLMRFTRCNMTAEEAFTCKKHQIVHKNKSNNKPIIIDDIYFESISECCKNYLHVSSSNVQAYLNGCKKMPEHYKHRGLRYYNKETDLMYFNKK